MVDPARARRLVVELETSVLALLDAAGLAVDPLAVQRWAHHLVFAASNAERRAERARMSALFAQLKALAQTVQES
jgi:hypothetical protein